MVLARADRCSHGAALRAEFDAHVVSGWGDETAVRWGDNLIDRYSTKSRKRMPPCREMLMAALVCIATSAVSATSVLGQTGAPKATEPPAKAGTTNGATIDQREAREFAEAARGLKGAAGYPECVWLGRRIIALMLRDDLDTAFRHLGLYDRFGCPGGQIKTSFRCLIRQGTRIDPKVDPKIFEKLDARTFACWLNPDGRPSARPAEASGASPPPAK
jgi:hypothetical protein